MNKKYNLDPENSITDEIFFHNRRKIMSSVLATPFLCASDLFATTKRNLPFIKDIDKVYSAASLIISRSGASIISELCFVGKPVIFIPSPNVAENHQSKNAKKLYDIGAAEYIEEDEIAYKLTSIINKIFVSQVYRDSLSDKILSLRKPTASKVIVDEIKKFLK